jgi:hypothetical protein
MKKLAFGALLNLSLMSTCFAGGPFTGTTDGMFGVANKTGLFWDWLTPPWAFNDNNGANAVVMGENTRQLSWGTPVPPSTASSVTFKGIEAPANFGPVNDEVAFKIGTLTYFNGTIEQGTGAYGAPLTITATATVPAGIVIDPLATSYQNIDTTNRNSNAVIDFFLNPILPAGWTGSELLSADGMILPDFGKFVLVKEGNSAAFDLMGKIVGDPMLIAVDVIVAPTFEDEGAVFDLSAMATLEIPEPSTVVLTLTAFVGWVGFRRRRVE